MPSGRKRKYTEQKCPEDQQVTCRKRAKKAGKASKLVSAVIRATVEKETARRSRRKKNETKKKAKECVVILSSSEEQEQSNARSLAKEAETDSQVLANRVTRRTPQRRKEGARKAAIEECSAISSTLSLQRVVADKAEKGERTIAKQAFRTRRRFRRKNNGVKNSAKESEVAQFLSAGLTVKSVLSLDGSTGDACLLFLARGQRVCIKGLCLIKTLIGSVEVYGFILEPEHIPVEIFSPGTSSLVVLSECSRENSSKCANLNRTLQDTLQKQDPEVMKKALVRSRKAATVLLLKSLKTVETNFLCSFQCFRDIFSLNLAKFSSFHKTEMPLKSKTAALGFILLEPDPTRCRVLTVSDQWKAAASVVCKTTGAKAKAPVVLICGGKDIGKSTFARYLTNVFLNRQQELYFLECDVGQSEFTPPGMISLNRVSSPVLGPPFTHLRQAERSVFFGDVSPKDKPGFYMQCIYNVYQTYADKYRNKLPLIVNTQGWVKGMGVPLLLDVIRMVKPTHIVQFSYTTKENANKNLPKMTADLLTNAPGWAVTVEEEQRLANNSSLYTDGILCPVDNGESGCNPVVLEIKTCESKRKSSVFKLKASDHRTLSLLSYFSRTKANTNHSSLARTSLLSCVPYSVPWNSVAIHLMHTELSWNQILYSVNASIVGLARCASDEMYRQEGDGSSPWYLKQNPIVECIGLGIVRNVDPVEGLLYVLTPLGLEDLKEVNTLLKGNLEIPAALLLSTNQGIAPYISSEFSFDLRGARARKVRYNLMRRRDAAL